MLPCGKRTASKTGTFHFLLPFSSYIINQDKRRKTWEQHFSMNILSASYVATYSLHSTCYSSRPHMASPSYNNLVYYRIWIGYFAWQIDRWTTEKLTTTQASSLPNSISSLNMNTQHHSQAKMHALIVLTDWNTKQRTDEE